MNFQRTLQHMFTKNSMDLMILYEVLASETKYILIDMLHSNTIHCSDKDCCSFKIVSAGTYMTEYWQNLNVDTHWTLLQTSTLLLYIVSDLIGI